MGVEPTPEASGKYVSRLIFNFVPDDLAMLLLGMLGDATRQIPHGKFA
jgi:hypothetical protein